MDDKTIYEREKAILEMSNSLHFINASDDLQRGILLGAAIALDMTPQQLEQDLVDNEWRMI